MQEKESIMAVRLVIPKSYSHDRIFNQHLTTFKHFYILYQKLLLISISLGGRLEYHFLMTGEKSNVASLVSHKPFHSDHFNASGILNCYTGDTRLGQILGK